MSASANLQIVQRIYKAIIDGDLSTLLNAMTDDVEFIIPGSSKNPAAGSWRGRRGVEQWVAAVNGLLAFELLQPDEFIVGRDEVVVLGHERCRMRATGHLVEVQWAHIWTLRDGLVSKAREYTDTAAWEAEFAGGGN